MSKIIKVFSTICSLFAATGVLAAEDTVLVLAGDSIITRPISVYSEPEFLALKALVASADVAITNLETNFNDYQYPPAALSGGIHLRSAPKLINELVWFGFDMVARANNHAGDWGVQGLLETGAVVKQAGLIGAGVGNSLRIANEPRYFETAGGRVALISVSATFTPDSVASDSLSDMSSRGGLNFLRHESIYQLDRKTFEQLGNYGEKIGLFTSQDGKSIRRLVNTFTLFDKKFVLGDNINVVTSANIVDMERISRSVSDAARQADIVVLSLHAHEWKTSREIPAQFIEEFSRGMIDAGADVIMGHGPHVLRGIEIYKGKPIFYSLGNFIFQNETTLRLPQEAYDFFSLPPGASVADFNDARGHSRNYSFVDKSDYWNAIVPRLRFSNGGLVGIDIYPISLLGDKPRSQRGRPVLAADNDDILKSIISLSTVYGTQFISIDDHLMIDLSSDLLN
jgi:poly-gamma-glutamate synthesis protein (capsule biosynthesis protein)